MLDQFATPEWKLLLSCCRKNPGFAEMDSRNMALDNAFDQERVLFLIERHRIAPMVYFNLRLEPKVQQSFKDHLSVLAQKNQLDSLEMRRMQSVICSQLDLMGLQGVFLKGVNLSERYYGDLGLRESVDIDILLEDHAIIPFAEWLYSLGYTSIPDLRKLNENQLMFYKWAFHDVLFTSAKNDPRPSIELHWKICVGEIFYLGHSRNHHLLSKSGFRVDLDKEEDLFIYLCVHGTNHAWFRLKWLFDLVQTVDRQNFKWIEVRARALSLKCLEHLEISFLVMQSLFDIVIPFELADNLDKNKYEKQVKYILKTLASDDTYNQNDFSRLKYFLFRMLLDLKNMKFDVFYKYLTGPKDWKAVRLPNMLFFLYFLLRPFIWVGRRCYSRSAPLLSVGICQFWISEL